MKLGSCKVRQRLPSVPPGARWAQIHTQSPVGEPLTFLTSLRRLYVVCVFPIDSKTLGDECCCATFVNEDNKRGRLEPRVKSHSRQRPSGEDRPGPWHSHGHPPRCRPVEPQRPDSRPWRRDRAQPLAAALTSAAWHGQCKTFCSASRCGWSTELPGAAGRHRVQAQADPGSRPRSDTV